MRWNKKITAIIIGTALILGLGTVIVIKSNNPKAKGVTIEKVAKKVLTETTTATGNVEAKYRNDIVLNPSQKVLKIMVQEGQLVKKGELLAVLDSSDYQNQLEKQKINLENAKLALNQMIQTGVTSEIRASENALSQAKYSLENAQRKYEEDSKKYEQRKILFAKGAISEDELKEAKKNAEDAATALKSAQDSLANAEDTVVDTNSNSNNKIATQKNQVALIEKDIESNQKKIQDSNIVANIDGKVIKVDGKENQFPSTGDQIIIDDVSQYKVVVELKQYDALKVVKGQKALIKIKGAKDGYTGTVIEIGQMAEAKTSLNGGDQEYKVKISVGIDNPKEEVKAGYEAEVQFILNQRSNATAIGFDGIKIDKTTGKKYVYVVDSNNKVAKRSIKVGVETEYYVEVMEGLKEGEQYVLNPPESLKEGDLVSPGSSAKTSSSQK